MHLFHGRNKNILKTHQKFPECFHFPATNLLKGKHLVMHNNFMELIFVEAVAEVLETQNILASSSFFSFPVNKSNPHDKRYCIYTDLIVFSQYYQHQCHFNT